MAGFTSLHPAGSRDYNREWQQAFRRTDAGKAHVRAMNLRTKGLSPDEYDAILNEQGGVCASCGEMETGVNQYGTVSLAIDHDHGCCPEQRACDKCRRGLLCMRCNRALGMLGDSIDTIEKLLNYRRSFA